MSFLPSSIASSSRSTMRSFSTSVSRSGKTGGGKASTTAKPKVTKKSAGPPPDLSLGDSTTEVLKKELFPSSRPNLKSAKPWSPPRPDRLAKLPLVLPSASAHETITRAALVYQRDLERERIHRLSLKHTRIFNACETLRLHDKALYDLATAEPRGSASATVPVLQGREKYEKLFPREMRLPTDTPGKTGWDYGWVYVPEEKAAARIDFKFRDDLKDATGTPTATGEGENAEIKSDA